MGDPSGLSDVGTPQDNVHSDGSDDENCDADNYADADAVDDVDDYDADDDVDAVDAVDDANDDAHQSVLGCIPVLLSSLACRGKVKQLVRSLLDQSTRAEEMLIMIMMRRKMLILMKMKYRF